MQGPRRALEPSSLAAALPLGLGGAARLRRPRGGRQQRAWRTGHAGAAGSRAASSTAADGQAATPLVDAVRERGDRSGDMPFHVPGHKVRGRLTALRAWLPHCWANAVLVCLACLMVFAAAAAL